MAMWCEELSASARAGLLADIDLLNPKNGRVYLRLMLYIARFGSAPADDRLAEHLGVTKRYWKERAWPSLEDMFEIRGNRIFHPEIGGAPDSRRKAAAQVAAQARWGSKPQVISGSEDGHHGRVTASESHTESHVNSMRGASESHADFDANAYSDASPDASGALLARSPSLASFSSFQPSDQSTESKEGSERECEDARASAYAPTHAQGMPSDAITHPVTASASHVNGYANGPGSHRSEPPAAQTRLPDDWEPAQQIFEAIELAGRSPEVIAREFRAHYKKKGTTMADWDAGFESWWLKQPKFDQTMPPPAQTLIGNRPAKPGKDAWRTDLLQDPRVRAMLGDPEPDDSPVIEGQPL